MFGTRKSKNDGWKAELKWAILAKDPVMSQVKIANHLNKRGVTSPSGKPWTQAMVSRYSSQLGFRKQGKNRNVPVAKPEKKAKVELVGVVDATKVFLDDIPENIPHFDDTKKPKIGLDVPLTQLRDAQKQVLLLERVNAELRKEIAALANENDILSEQVEHLQKLIPDETKNGTNMNPFLAGKVNLIKALAEEIQNGLV